MAAGVALAALGAPALTRAQNAPSQQRLTPAEDAADPLEKLDKIEKQIIQDRSSVQTLTTSADRLAEDQRRLQGELIRTASTAQAHERDLSAVEQQLAGLETREAAAARSLASKRGKLASLLAVLQRMGREPPPALIVRPDDAAVAARSAMLLSAVVPTVQHEATRLSGDLTALRKIRQEVAAKRMALAQSASALEGDRRALALLLSQKRDLAQRTGEALTQTSARLNNLAGQAKDLRALITSLDEDARRPGAAGGSVVVDRIAAAGSSRTMTLDGLRGVLALPASGSLMTGFGGDDGLGGHLAGILLGTRPGAQVTSPCDGKVLFAGPFRGYGQMLIIGASGGYHVLLSGLTHVDGVVGQEVLAGEPLGRMGPGQSQGRQSPPIEKLYIEFRRNGAPVDPAPWFAALREKVSG